MESVPASVEKLLSEGLLLGQSGNFLGAAERFRQAIEIQPTFADSHYNLGVALKSVGHGPAALQAFEKAVELRPAWAEAWFNLANSHRDTQARDKAIHALENAIRLRPNYIKALNNLGNLYFDQGHFARAENLHRQAIQAKPDYAEGLFNLGRTLRRLRRNKEAIEVAVKACNLQPGNSRYKLKLAEYQKAAGQTAAAKQTLELIRSLDAHQPDATSQLVGLLREEGRFDEALTMLNDALQHRADGNLLWLRADILRTQQRLDEALIDLDRAIALDPLSAQVHNLHGVIRFARAEVPEAIVAYERALEIKPDLVEARNNLGAALQGMRRFDESLEAFDTALRLKPDFALARLNRSLCLLRQGQFEEGWREFEWRFLCQDFRLTPNTRPAWAGEDLQGKTILLRTEQGLGDTFQFIRYAKVVKERGARIVVECQDAACELVQVCEGVDVVAKRGAPLPNFDVQIPLMSLPSVCGTTLGTVPRNVPYLFANPQLVDKWRERLVSLDKLVVGIGWQGNRKFQADNVRSMSLSHFKPLAQDGVSLVSLQKNDGAEQLKLDLGFKVHDFSDELDQSGAFRDTAAIMCACDLIITSDTAIAHLAGALGRPVWVALSYSADWRWLASGEACPWYPTMRLFRQHTWADWPSVFADIAQELSVLRAGEQTPLMPQAITQKCEVRVETSPGELVDKITILEIKQERIQDEAKRAAIERELVSLLKTQEDTLPPSRELRVFASELRIVNEQLWDIEDEIRDCERAGDFGPRFIELARSVYITNDRRAKIKRQINLLLDAAVVEVKSYAPYH